MPQSIDRTILNKVPLVTLYFWIIKILATTVGETGADFLNFNLGLGLTVTSLIAAVVLIGFLVLQMRQTQYVPWIYWVTSCFVERDHTQVCFSQDRGNSVNACGIETACMKQEDERRRAAQ